MELMVVAMKIYKYKIIPIDVIVTLKAEGPNSSGKITYEGERLNRQIVVLRLSDTTGAFGHIFYPLSSTPIDLDFALRQTFGNENIEELGEIIESYDPDIPEGAMT